MIKLEEFEQWLSEQLAKHKEDITESSIRHGTQRLENLDAPLRLGKPGMDVSITTTGGLCGIMLFWISGEADVYVLGLQGEFVYPDHYITVSSAQEFDTAFREFFDILFSGN